MHSLEAHLFGVLKAAYEHGLKKVSVHVFGDGRDVAPASIKESIVKLQAICDQYGYKIASVAGRFYAMDRDQIFERNQKAYDNLLGKSNNTFTSALDYVESQYQKQITDEFFEPAFDKSANMIKDHDSIIFFNFRPDRARQLTHFFRPSKIYDYKNSAPVKIEKFVSMMKYENMDTIIAFDEMKITQPIGYVMEQANKKQLRVAETQKYAHVTYFMDGGIDISYKNSKRIMVDSIKAEFFADVPHMSAKGITDEVIKNAKDFDLTILNYANPDMVGHTGDLKATIEAVTFLDSQIKRL